ncbi:MAG: hypothetical protein ACE5H8_04405 [Alphaproteobacteria bacterium]
MVDEAKQLTLFRPGPGRDLTDVRYESEIAGLAMQCEYDSDGFVDVDVDVDFTFSRGPAADDTPGQFEYFVAITDPDGKIIAKRVFPLAPEFPELVLRIGVTEQLHQRIFLAPGKDASAHRIFIGFQLSRAQLEELRARRR